MNDNTFKPPPLMTSAEVAAALKVDVKTVVGWAQRGLVACFKTPGGEWRFREADIAAILNGGQS